MARTRNYEMFRRQSAEELRCRFIAYRHEYRLEKRTECRSIRGDRFMFAIYGISGPIFQGTLENLGQVPPVLASVVRQK